DTRIKTFDLNEMRFEIPKINIDGMNTTVKQWAVSDTSAIPSTDDLGLEQATGADAAMPDLQLGSLSITDIKAAYEDQTSALSAHIFFKELLVDFNALDLNGETVDIKRILFDENDTRIAFGKIDKTDQVTSNETPDSSNSADINWKVKIADLQLNKN